MNNTNTKLQVLDKMDHIFALANGCKLQPAVFQEADAELSWLAEYFKVSKQEAFFISLVFSLQFKHNHVNVAEMAEHCECTPLKVLAHSDELDALQEKGLLIKKKKRRENLSGAATDAFNYCIKENIIQAIMRNQPLPISKKGKMDDVLDVLESINSLGKQREDGELSGHELSRYLERIIRENLSFPLIKRVWELGLPITDLFLFLHLTWDALSGKEGVDLVEKVGYIIEQPSGQIRYMQELQTGENALIKQRLAELEENMILDNLTLVLSNQAKELLKSFGLTLFVNRKHIDHIISHESIQSKTLFFNEKETKQLRLFESMLIDTNLGAIRERLGEKNLPQGVAALFYGPPGTGKTESALQIAKMTGRDIIKVEISQIKSMWFGESEKNIKRLFSDYKHFMEQNPHTPILLFNEADAVLSKRKSIDSSMVRQTENTIQNIILEEMETFKGILIATTNLTGNLDSAFERRFLFKIHLQQPDIIVKTKIWKLKLPELSLTDCMSLASEFDFSGGQIDNVVRKCEIREVLYDLSYNIDIIREHCKEEVLGCKRIAIGFTRS